MNNKYFNVIYSPALSEKAYKIMEKENKYLFFVNPKSNKTEIKNVFSFLFSVKVKKINIIVRKPKKKKVKSYVGYTNKKKIAIINLKKGEKLDIFNRTEKNDVIDNNSLSKKVSEKLFTIPKNKKKDNEGEK